MPKSRSSSMLVFFILLITIIPCWIFLTFTSITAISKFDVNNNHSYYYYVKQSLYDELPLMIEKQDNDVSEKNSFVDCNTIRVECNTDQDCINSCLPITLLFGNNSIDSTTTNTVYCLPSTSTGGGQCAYIYTQNRHHVCLNEGTPIRYFQRGQMVFGCICPEDFLGRYCEYINMLKPAKEKTFDLGYIYNTK